MLSAAEVAMHQAATDDAEWQRQRQAIYAPPAGHRTSGSAAKRGARRGGGTAGAGGMTRDAAAALVASMDAEDARLTGRR